MSSRHRVFIFGTFFLFLAIVAGCPGKKPKEPAGPPKPPKAAQQLGPQLKPVQRIAQFQKALKDRETAIFEEARQSAQRLAAAPDKLQPNAPNVVLLTVDTLRFDDTSGFGGQLETTPFLAKLAKQGVTFTNAISPGPWTVPAMYSLITGMYPTEHGITGGLINPLVRGDIVGQAVLPDVAHTLAERLKDLGYGTFGACTNFHMSPKYGFAQGFDMFVGEDFDSLPFPTFVAESFIPQMRKVEKYFVWAHFFDPHAPYQTHSPWFTQWNDSPFFSNEELIYDLLLQYYREKAGIGADGPFFPPHAVPLKNLANLIRGRPATLNVALYQKKSAPDSPELKFLRAAYRSELRATDRAMEKLLEKLEIGDNTMIIVVADHGEEFMDHGRMDHRLNGSVYQELIHVPMLMVLPGRQHAGKVVDTPVSTLDIMATILDVLGHPMEGQTSSRSLVPLITGKSVEPRPVYSELHEVKLGEFRAIIEYPWKYIHSFQSGLGMLFNLSSDPGEKKDLSSVEKELAESMKKRLLEWTASKTPRYPAGARIQLSPEEKQKLRAMGYMH
jgi:arylsulfatase A-like enzyme